MTNTVLAEPVPTGETVTLTFAPPVGSRWETDVELGDGDGHTDTVRARSRVVASDPTFVEIASEILGEGTAANAGPASAPGPGPHALERFDSRAMRVEGGEPASRFMGTPLLISYPDHPVAVGDRWTAAPQGPDRERMPFTTIEMELVSIGESTVEIRAVARGASPTATTEAERAVAVLEMTATIDRASGWILAIAITIDLYRDGVQRSERMGITVRARRTE